MTDADRIKSALLDGLRRPLDIRGRTDTYDFWFFYLGLGVMGYLAWAVVASLPGLLIPWAGTVIYAQICHWAVMCRRLNDAGKSRWMAHFLGVFAACIFVCAAGVLALVGPEILSDPEAIEAMDFEAMAQASGVAMDVVVFSFMALAILALPAMVIAIMTLIRLCAPSVPADDAPANLDPSEPEAPQS